MEKLTIREHNVETGEIIDRELTEDELKLHQESLLADKQRLEDAALKESKKNELLNKLGITEEEAKLLLS